VRQFVKEENLVRGLRLALVGTLASALYLAYEYLVTRPDYVEYRLGAGSRTPQFALGVLGIFVALFISATAGFAWIKGRGLVGFGSWRRVRHDLVLILPIGAALAALTLLVLEPTLYKPLLPKERNPFQPVFAALFEEVICRWGIFAIAYRLSGRLWPSVLTSALFNVVVALNATFKIIAFTGADIRAWHLAVMIAIKFALAVGYALFFVRKGLFSTMALRFVAALPAPVLALF
jgi:membrane protease YdiL (CAAX protease family)